MSIMRRGIFYSIVFILIMLLFNFTLLKEAATALTSQDVFINDGLLTEFLSESGYQNLKQGSDIFSLSHSVVYPFRINTALNDPNTGNILFFLFLRPFVSSYIATISIVIINFLLSGLCMYFLLKKLKITTAVAYLISLVYTFMPFMSHRVLGHYSYTAIYLFPLAYLVILHIFTTKYNNHRILYGSILGMVMAWSLMINPYYFFSLGLSFVFFGFYYLVTSARLVMGIFKKFLYTGAAAVGTCIMVLIPWLQKVYETHLFQEPNPTVHLGSWVTLSADVLSFITPSYYNPLYRYIIETVIAPIPYINRFVHFYVYSWERFAYPGIIFLCCFLGILYYRRHLSKKVQTALYPYFFVSIAFIVLALGPFLKIANKWHIIVEEGIPIIIPLPYLILKYIPILDSLRAPMRFTPAYVFFGLIAAAFFLHYFFSKLPKKYTHWAVVVLLSVFILDQGYQIPNQQDQNIHINIYKYIQQDPQKGTVLEIPFTLRDGLQYRGFVHAIEPMKGYLIHKKPIIGGYLPRIQPYIFSYHEQLPFISYIASITDKGNYNPFLQQPQPVRLTEFAHTKAEIEREIAFFDIQYITLKKDEEYSQPLQDLIGEVGFQKIMNEQQYDLYHRPLVQESFTHMDMGSADDYLFVVDGLSESKGDYRATQKQVVRFLIKPQDAKTLTIQAITPSLSPADVYINHKKISSLLFSPVKNTYTISLPPADTYGIDEFIIRFEDPHPKVNFYSLTLSTLP